MQNCSTAEEYLQLLGDWVDPNPAPVIEMYDGIHVVRDDLLEYGSKIRFVDYFIGHAEENKDVEEWVFGSCPATGYAQISLPVVCERYGKKAVLFMAERSMDNLHPYQQRGIDLGTVYHWVKMGMLNVTQSRAKKYTALAPETRRVLPLGLEHDSVIASIIKVARDIPVKPEVVWSVGSSGTINRGLQLAFPDAEIHVVQVGHSMKEREIGRAIHHISPYKFDRPVKAPEVPPFPSAPTYDAKGWKPMKDWYDAQETKPVTLFWNVAH
jgi:hypothetical protein